MRPCGWLAGDDAKILRDLIVSSRVSQLEEGLETWLLGVSFVYSAAH